MATSRFRCCVGALASIVLLACGGVLAQDAKDDDPTAQDDLADDADSEWPREIDAPTATIVVYQPQLDACEGGVIEAHSALSITPTGATAPVFGAVWFKAKMEVDRDARVCTIFDVTVPSARFPESTPEEEKALADVIQEVAPTWAHPLSMDRLLPALAAIDKHVANDDRVRNDPPRIVVETRPALLVSVDGEARLGAVAGSRLQRVVNSPIAVVFDPATRTFWIDAGAAWMFASAVDGPYRAADAAPPEVAAVRTSNERGAQPATADDEGGVTPVIVVAHEPTELLVFDGAPRWSALVADEPLYATNTSVAVFRTSSDGRYYVLLSGRWFRSGSLTEGPWEFVESDRLPDCFRDIPEDSEMGGVLAHVAGTELADEAILDAQVPQTKAIRRDAASCVVVYDGEPKFIPIPGTDLRYAANTDSQVLLCRERYYCCDQGAWFVSASPTGPWRLADEVPQSFQDIPPECPVYNVKFVYVVDAAPDVVYVGCTPGYFGWYPWHGVVVWGTGWRYPCWYGDFWYPRCATWGVSVGYNPWSGWWYEGLSLRWGRWSIGVGFRDGWGWGGAWWGPSGYRSWRRHAGESHRPISWGRAFDRGRPGEHRHGPSLYDSPRNRARNAPDRATTRPRPRAPSPPARPVRPAAPRSTRPRNDVFLDRDGGIFRRDADGTWQKRDGRQWRPAPTQGSTTPPRPRVRRPPMRSAPTPQLGRDAWARDRGSARAKGGGRRR